MTLRWLIRRLSCMSVGEVGARLGDAWRQRRWRWRMGNGDYAKASRPWAASPKPLPAALDLPKAAAARVVAAAECVLAGGHKVFTHNHPAFGSNPDWFVDPLTGLRADSSSYCFDVRFRDAADQATIKYVWESSRHQHLTVLAAAWHLTGDERFALRVGEHLQSWWRQNPVLTGVHWASGIELGVRLLSWIWTRRLLEGWAGAPDLFENNSVFLSQLYHHQVYLRHFPSHHSSANNHLLAELAGLFASACAFPCFAQSAAWVQWSRTHLAAEIDRQTFACGLNRELATDYHGFVLEILLAAAVEGEAAGHSLGGRPWECLRAMCDALAAVLDGQGRPPRQGDGDGGNGLVLDGEGADRWASLLHAGRRLFGACPWWPSLSEDDLRGVLLAAIAPPPPLPANRPQNRPKFLEDAGQVFLCTGDGAEEIYCRCDGGRHGFLSIAGHAHADALSVELRVGGVDILADPGTYLYYGAPKWRRYFRSTAGHNTLELFGRDQSVAGGPFLWTTHVNARTIRAEGLDGGAYAVWAGEHSGYGGAVHRRTVTLDRHALSLSIMDEVVSQADGLVPARLLFHLGPNVVCQDDGVPGRFRLAWRQGDGRAREALLVLPDSLSWKAVTACEQTPLGWYSPTFGEKVPSITLVGHAELASAQRLITSLEFRPGGAAF